MISLSLTKVTAGELTITYCPDTTAPFPSSPGTRNVEGPNLYDARSTAIRRIEIRQKDTRIVRDRKSKN
jgi:hypothetical protein